MSGRKKTCQKMLLFCTFTHILCKFRLFMNYPQIGENASFSLFAVCAISLKQQSKICFGDRFLLSMCLFWIMKMEPDMDDVIQHDLDNLQTLSNLYRQACDTIHIIRLFHYTLVHCNRVILYCDILYLYHTPISYYQPGSYISRIDVIHCVMTRSLI